MMTYNSFKYSRLHGRNEVKAEFSLRFSAAKRKIEQKETHVE